MSSKILEKYHKLLPPQITVLIKKTKDGFVAEIKTFKYCHTQGRNFAQLIEMINDAVFTYLDIPEKYHSKLGIYLPLNIIDEVKRIKLQEAFRDIIKQPKYSRSIFSRLAPVIK